jgi:hypothetical protein
MKIAMSMELKIETLETDGFQKPHDEEGRALLLRIGKY